MNKLVTCLWTSRAKNPTCPILLCSQSIKSGTVFPQAWKMRHVTKGPLHCAVCNPSIHSDEPLNRDRNVALCLKFHLVP